MSRRTNCVPHDNPLNPVGGAVDSVTFHEGLARYRSGGGMDLPQPTPAPEVCDSCQRCRMQYKATHT